MRTTNTRVVAARFEKVRSARRQIIRDLNNLGVVLEDAVAADVQLCLTELLGNAIAYGCGGEAEDDTLRISYGAQLHADGTLRIWVADPASELPRLVNAETEATGGRGLLLVEKCMDKIGWHVVPPDPEAPPRAKIVWFEIAATVADNETAEEVVTSAAASGARTDIRVGETQRSRLWPVSTGASRDRGLPRSLLRSVA
ncbi:ATP-binding protein [Kitasatospora sp. NBC_01300]|uniref:ATP-binding protein n=1 Tax=Kitasatospora sp. NBC_01300 TaxID=2903574 RepID=UPI002F91A9B3|nr:ATP-binding protein [Kitasatospora sp. NBC_01300]